MIRSVLNTRLMTAVVEKNKGAYGKKETRGYPVLPPFPHGVEKAIAIIEQWVKDHNSRMLKAEFVPSVAYQKDARYYPYHESRGHMVEQCFIFRRIFDE